MHVCERERERECVSACVCVTERERERVCVCVCVCERERENVCVPPPLLKDQVGQSISSGI